jgi:pimeloyl-ACP methyl ester carboxylesterase
MRNVTAALAVLGLAACGTTGPGVGEGPTPFDPTATWPTASKDLQLSAGGRTFGATITAPTGPGPWPAVLLFAGSGPMDRNWSSRLLPGDNGSGRLLAEALAFHGVVVIRWDKSGSDPNPGPHDHFTMDTYTDEAKAALDVLRARPDVRQDAIFAAGHSEGGIHATRLAAKVGDELRGVIFLSVPGRSMATVIVEQLEGNFRNSPAHLTPEQIAAQMKPIKAAFDDFVAGRPVDVEHVSQIPTVRRLVAVITRPETAALARPLFAFEPAAEAAKLPQEDFFVGGGDKDVQIDPKTDGGALRDALLGAGKRVTYFVAPDMDHVLKHEPKSLDELRGDLEATQQAYNAPGRTLEPGFVVAVLRFIAAAAGPASE